MALQTLCSGQLITLTFSFPHLFAFSSLGVRFLLRLGEEHFHLALPVEEEEEQCHAAYASNEIAYFCVHTHRLIGDADEGDADKCHKQGWNEAYEIVLLFQ